jgi:hypothetical protein
MIIYSITSHTISLASSTLHLSPLQFQFTQHSIVSSYSSSYNQSTSSSSQSKNSSADDTLTASSSTTSTSNPQDSNSNSNTQHLPTRSSGSGSAATASASAARHRRSRHRKQNTLRHRIVMSSLRLVGRTAEWIVNYKMNRATGTIETANKVVRYFRGQSNSSSSSSGK